MATKINVFKTGDEFYLKEKWRNITLGKKYKVLGMIDDTIFFINDKWEQDHIYFKHAKRCEESVTSDTKNNGGETDYYKIKEDWKTAQDIIEARKMNFAQGNIFKVAITFNVGRHQGTDYLRELNKMEYFIKREKKRIAQEGF